MSTSGTGATNNLFDLYVADVISLARTMVIKFDQVAEATNNLVILKGGQAEVDQDNRRTWKYFQNISGDYNSTDTPMYVQSLDGNGEILFSKNTLAANPGTKAAYVYGSYYYRELVAKYPDQEPLILGIIYPCDIDQAIAAKDGTILAYPSFLVEEHETDFLSKLQGWIYNYVGRWVVKAYAITDDLYVPSYVAQLTMNMIPAIMNIRLAACKTNQAHSFHIGQYLRSHGFLDFYLAELTREQALTFYRNIKYYVRNSGFENTFTQLVELLLTKRGLPAYEYKFRQNDASIAYLQTGDFTNLYPLAKFQRKPLNAPAEQQILSDYTLDDVLGVINQAAPSNDLWRQGHEEKMVAQFMDAPTSKLNTKIIEVGLPATAVNAARTPEFIYLQQWIAFAAAGTYTNWINIVPPGTDAPIQLTQPRALALWIYAIHKAAAPSNEDATFHKLTRVPMIAVDEVAQTRTPDATAIRSKTTSAVTDALFDEMLSYAVPAPATVTSLDQFKTFCGNMYSADLAQYRLYSSQEDPRACAQLQFVSDQLRDSYHTPIVGHYTLVNQQPVGMLYSDFFNEIGFNPSTYSADEFMELATLIFTSATGYDLDSVDNPLNVQKAMVSLLRQLSSYSVLFITNSDLNSSVLAGPQAIRVTVKRQASRSKAYVDTAPINVIGVSSEHLQNRVFFNLDAFSSGNDPVFSTTRNVKVPTQEPVTREVGFTIESRNLIDTCVDLKTDEDPFLQFSTLTKAQKLQLAS